MCQTVLTLPMLWPGAFQLKQHPVLILIGQMCLPLLDHKLPEGRACVIFVFPVVNIHSRDSINICINE